MPRNLKTMIQQAGRHGGGWRHAHGLSPAQTMHPDGLVPAGRAMHAEGLSPATTRSGDMNLGRKGTFRRGPRAPAPPSISMPKPSGPNPTAVMGGMGGMNGMSAAAGVGMSAAVGAMAGGIYGNRDGNTLAGVGRGALGGAILGAMGGMGAPAIAKAGMRQGLANKQFMSVAGSYSTNMVKATRGLSSETGRTAMFAAGGLLGGTAFGGQGNSKKRGFNRDRGNSFSR